MSKLTSAPCAGAERLTVKVAFIVPLLPSLTVTSLIERFGVAPPAPNAKLRTANAERFRTVRTEDASEIDFTSYNRYDDLVERLLNGIDHQLVAVP